MNLPKRLHLAKILRRLEKTILNPQPALTHENPFQLLVATILSAQCTDARVNSVTPMLFKTYPTPADLAKAGQEDLEQMIRPTGFYKNKAKALCAAAQMIVKRYGGAVPKRLEELTNVPGVGRKTANVVLSHAFGIPGVVVDTHVRRVSNRLKLTRSNNPERIERDLMRLMPASEWIDASSRLLLHGRHVCKARAPLCRECTLFDICPADREKKAAVNRGSRGV